MTKFHHLTIIVAAWLISATWAVVTPGFVDMALIWIKQGGELVAFSWSFM